jgi:serine/threonine protein kinase
VDSSWNPKVCDYGLARLKDATLQHTGGRGTGSFVCGSAAWPCLCSHSWLAVYWTAPEILTHKPYNELVDVFSYGVIDGPLACVLEWCVLTACGV